MKSIIYLSIACWLSSIGTIYAQAEHPTKKTQHTFNAVAQNQAKGGGVNFEHGICLTNEERAAMMAKADENVKKHNIQFEKNAGMMVTYDWPLRQNPAFNYNSTYAISNYVDQNTNSGQIQDYNCGTTTYDGHNGTDMFLWPFDHNQMENNQTWVVAAADGLIVFKEDGRFDNNCVLDMAQYAMSNRIILQHADGNRTLYIHMKRNSLTGKGVGDTVNSGEYLGVVASSGYSTGPHLHFECRTSSGARIDPYTGSCNSLNNTSFWNDQRPYFDPNINAALTQSAPPVLRDCPQLDITNVATQFDPGDEVFFVGYFRNFAIGNTATYRVRRPNGTVWNEVPVTATVYYPGTYWYVDATLPTNTPTGTWTFEIALNGNTVVSEFNVGNVVTPTCNDGIQNGNETGIDCGGSCPPCVTCNDGIQNGNETGIDCGGSCPPCVTCNDGIQNGNETGIDCGGSCPPCPISDYCTSQGNNTDYEYIQNITFAGITNTSGDDGGYADYTSQTATVSAGTSYNITLVPGFARSPFYENWRVWIDFNRDGDFTDSGEQLLSEGGNSTINSSMTIPSSASSGTTRMRVSMKWNSTITSCETFAYGEVEDYSISIGGAGCNVGAACTDNDACTVGDTYDSNCNCIGTFLDSDNDGICNANDDCPNDPTNTCNASSYCTSQGNDTSREYIQRITFADINNNSGNNNGYADYTAQTANINAGQSHSIRLVPASGGRSVQWRVWIDFNQDGDFDDSRERVLMQAGNATINSNIHVPVASIALSGQTRMRVSIRYGGAPDICETFQYGEVEDYTVNISNGNKISDEAALNIRNYPNPFNDYTNIEFSVLNDSPVTLKIYDITGRQVATLLDNELTKVGEHRAIFDGSKHSSGMYIYKIQVGEYVGTGKMNIIK